MLLYLIMYLLVSFLLIKIWFIVYKKYKANWSWKYFLFFSFLSAIWCLLYLLSYSSTYDKDILLYISRLLYSLSIPASYSIVIFLLKINNKKSKSDIKMDFIIFSIFLLIIWLSVFSKYVIVDMRYDEVKLLFFEEYWSLYSLYSLLYLLVLPIFLVTSFYKLKSLSLINKVRFKIMWFWFIFLMIMFLIFLVILPALGVFILQKEIILFFIPFILFSRYSIYKYYYIDIKIWFSLILIFIFSLIISILITLWIYNTYLLYLNNLDSTILQIWHQWINASVKDLIIFFIFNLLLFKLIYFILKNKIIWKRNFIFNNELWKLKNEIPFITSFDDLNSYIKMKFNNLYKIKYSEIRLFSDNNITSEFNNYFLKEKLNKVFINDEIFLEENKNRFNKKNIISEINNDCYIIFPIYSKNHSLIWLFFVWRKPLNDIYYKDEINAIRDLIEFIWWHLKYLRIYDRINDLNINLDKMVDKKTMEYNTLINKQKDFISFVSHEIKWPIWSSIFQVDCLLDDLEDWKTNKGYLKKELELLNNQLIKIGDLTNKIFSIEKYDIWKVKLTKEKVNINDLISSELVIYMKNNENIEFIVNFDLDIWFLELDKVQMLQVINNLLTNAVKFASKWVENPKIAISTYKKGSNIYIEIEDNWKEFEYTDIAALFQKYTTWKGSSIWLWMWLYLCKKIVEMHNWEIYAENSQELGWAKFVIILSKKNNTKLLSKLPKNLYLM